MLKYHLTLTYMTFGLLSENSINHKKSYFIIKITLLASIMLIFGACTNDIKKVNKIVDLTNSPTLSAKEFYSTRTDSGKIVLKAFAAIFEVFPNAKEPYTECRNGIKVETYSNYPIVESMIKAGYAKKLENKGLWEARYNVIVANSKGDTLTTELMYWDENNKKIYTDKFCRVKSFDGIFYGKNGFEADDSFKKWKFKNTEGIVNVKE